MIKRVESTGRYESINGLRTIACLGIVLMHIKSNTNIANFSNISKMVIAQFTNFVFLFMIISAFGMCCGYYYKIKDNKISPESFYSKRIKKIFPFFAFLIVIDILINHNISTIIEGFANGTLLFGFLQKELNVIGVGWFIGLIFVFYLMFPFFTCLFSNKKRAWISTFLALLMNFSCIYYFNVGRNNMFYSFIFFCVGGLLFLYKDNIISIFKNNKVIGILFVFISLIVYFILPINNYYFSTIKILFLFVSLFCYAISYNSFLLDNNITRFIGNISFEIYLCHMMVFRLIEKVNIEKIVNNQMFEYIIICFLVILVSIAVSTLFNKILLIISNRIMGRK